MCCHDISNSQVTQAWRTTTTLSLACDAHLNAGILYSVHLRRENVLLTEDVFGNPMFRINILQGTKNSLTGHRYYLEGGPGLAGDPRVDPVLALAMYLLKRGELAGPLFVNFKNVGRDAYEMDPRTPLKDGAFLNDLRDAFDEAGVDSYRFLGTHSFKRGGVQLYRLLGVPDQEIKERGHWQTFSAYFAYVQASNRLEKRYTYTTAQAALADVISQGGEVTAGVLEELGIEVGPLPKQVARSS